MGWPKMTAAHVRGGAALQSPQGPSPCAVPKTLSMAAAATRALNPPALRWCGASYARSPPPARHGGAARAGRSAGDGRRERLAAAVIVLVAAAAVPVALAVAVQVTDYAELKAALQGTADVVEIKANITGWSAGVIWVQRTVTLVGACGAAGVQACTLDGQGLYRHFIFHGSSCDVSVYNLVLTGG